MRGCPMSARGKRRKPGGASAPSTVTATKSRAQEPRSTLSRRQKWLLRLAITIVSPLLFLIVLEVGLRGSLQIRALQLQGGGTLGLSS
jgi:hypothetical protein